VKNKSSQFNTELSRKVGLTHIMRNFSQKAKNLKSPETMEVRK